MTSRAGGGPAAGRAFQKTLAGRAACRGVGVHSGAEVEMALSPAPADTGLRILRTDAAAGTGEIPADLAHVVDHRLSTSLGNRHGVTVATVEHLMAAFSGCAVDNAVVEVSGPEIPVMDGSAAPFVEMIRAAGIRVQDAPRRAIRVLEPVAVDDGAAAISLAPAESFGIEFTIDFAASAIGRQTLSIELVNGAFAEDIAAARTFGLVGDVGRRRAEGRGRGGSLDNAIVVDGPRVLNPDGLRFPDEFVRHKILDCIGDLYLAGAPIIGRVAAHRSGHAANHDLLRALFADPARWAWDDASPESDRIPARP